MDEAKPPILPSGPSKATPFDLAELQKELAGLDHCPKRTNGSGELYKACKDRISRRDFRNLVRLARKDANLQRRNNLRCVKWLEPGLVWAIDEAEINLDFCGEKLIMLNMRDLCSGFKFDPVLGPDMKGAAIAAHLDRMFTRFGAPLFLKRDNGSALNDDAVNAVLEKHFVIPLNSPAYYPPYNGAIEHDQGEIKAAVAETFRSMPDFSLAHAPAYASLAVHELNHMPRRVLGGRCSCQNFYEKKGGPYKRERKKIFDRILGLARWIHSGMDKEDVRSFASAWRIAAESWLGENRFIEVRVMGKVLPYFHPFFSHN